MSFTQFTVHGPYAVPPSCLYKYYGYWQIVKGAVSFWTDSGAKALEHRKGCYAFGIKAGRSIRLIYVGLTVD